MFAFFFLLKQEQQNQNKLQPTAGESIPLLPPAPFSFFTQSTYLNYPTLPCLTPLSKPFQTQTNLTTTPTLPIHPITNHQHRGEGGVELNPHFSYVS